ncbi:SGNH/GDSL hydrolase family protein [Actinomadura rugatobispora]|uniref:SGNH/GDSL hydrolase family protein n=1 Tax=Actinomadura rugatobispora TaxID=1994 RepID=A0ABW0ZVN2_9ACTN|nr:SGNH/GDSL hydrolase family protein [Actinomadura rugatobispora]
MRIPGVRFGPRGRAVAVLVGLLAVAITPLVALPAVRCEVFGAGCPAKMKVASADPARAQPQRRALTPAEAAAQGTYVALGDSYSSGLGAEATVADQNPLERCQRTSKAYYHQVAKSFPFKGSAFWACSGATTRTFLSGKSGEPSQLTRIDANTSLITISVGGNDVGFSKVLAGCVVKLPWSRSCSDQGRDVAARMAELRRTLPDLYSKVTAKSPKARVIVMGYPRAFSEADGAGGDNLSVADQQWLNARARDLNELIRQTTAEADQRIAATGGAGSVEFADAYSTFAGHEVGSSDPYMNGLAVSVSALAAEPRSFHPTVRGHEALARLFVDQVGKGPGRPLNQYR